MSFSAGSALGEKMEAQENNLTAHRSMNKTGREAPGTHDTSYWIMTIQQYVLGRLMSSQAQSNHFVPLISSPEDSCAE